MYILISFESYWKYVVIIGLIGCFPGLSMTLPLVPGGHITSKAPFYRSLSPQLKAKSLALGAEHAILLSASGAVYTWGLGR